MTAWPRATACLAWLALGGILCQCRCLGPFGFNFVGIHMGTGCVPEIISLWT